MAALVFMSGIKMENIEEIIFASEWQKCRTKYLPSVVKQPSSREDAVEVHHLFFRTLIFYINRK
jgi:hypothetical protein